MMCSSARRSPDLIIEGRKNNFSVFFFVFIKHICTPQVVFGEDPILSVQDSSLVVPIRNLSTSQRNPNLQVINPSPLYRSVQLKIGRTELNEPNVIKWMKLEQPELKLTRAK